MIKSREKRAFYSAATAARKLGISTNTLREYVKTGLVRPYSDPENGRSLFSDRDLTWIRRIRKLIHQEGLNIASIRRLLAVSASWQITNFPNVKNDGCRVPADKTRPCWVTPQRRSIKKINMCWACKVYSGARKRLK